MVQEFQGGSMARTAPKDIIAQAKKPSPQFKRIRDAEETGPRPMLKVTKTPLLASIVPASIWRIPPFRYAPETISPESEQLENVFIDWDRQLEYLAAFTANPDRPMVYCVTSSPDDLRAKYFAAYLAQLHMTALGSKANVLWSTLYYGANEALRDSFNEVKSTPTMLVISNLTCDSTPRRIEDARDLLERYIDRIPIVVVAAGEDPISFMTFRLRSPVNAVTYFRPVAVRR